jgi:hypothetical protein
VHLAPFGALFLILYLHCHPPAISQTGQAIILMAGLSAVVPTLREAVLDLCSILAASNLTYNLIMNFIHPPKQSVPPNPKTHHTNSTVTASYVFPSLFTIKTNPK